MGPYTHKFHKLAERYACWEMSLTDDSPGGLIEKINAVMPELMPDNEVLIYQWVPPKRDPVSGQLLEVKRLRLYRVPMGAKGPLVGAITKVLDAQDAPPAQVKLPDKLEIPPEVQAMNDEDLDTIAPQVGLTFPKGADVQVKRVLLARECITSARGKMVLDRIRTAISRTIKPMQQPIGV